MKHKHISIIVLLLSFHICFAQANDTRLNAYRDKIFAVFNKCNSQDDEITKAIKAKNSKDIESGRIALLQCATGGLKQLNTMESFNGDPALKYSCRDVLKFYKQLAESDLPQVRDFFITEENFLRIKNEFEKKKAKKHSQQEIYAYNNEIKKYNNALMHYTQLTTFIVSSRKLTLYNWNASLNIFMDTHKSKS